MLSHVPSSCQLSDDEVGGLRLVGARPSGVRHVGVGLVDLPLPHWCPTRYGLLQWRMTCRWSIASPCRCLGDVVDVRRVDVGVDVNDVAASTSGNAGLA